MLDIWKRIRAVRDARREEMNRRMEAYDLEVYYPAIQALQDECREAGHVPGSYKSNGFGWNWTECQSCGARVEQWHDDDPWPTKA